MITKKIGYKLIIDTSKKYKMCLRKITKFEKTTMDKKLYRI